jgi:hypothetical protein
MRYLIVSLFLVGLGCSSSVIPSESVESPNGREGDPSIDEALLPADAKALAGRRDDTDAVKSPSMLPVDGQLTYKGFGEYVEDRFTGYHVGIDFEASADTPVYAVLGGEVVFSDWVSGYGGVIVVRTMMSDQIQSTIYGHLDPASLPAIGSSVAEGEQIAMLGEKGPETDGEREHLHVAMYEGSEVRLNGYETHSSALVSWLNPINSVRLDTSVRSSTELTYDGRDDFPLEFEVPAGWDVEFIPSIQSLNLYTLAGEGTARERSQMLIRYFDASAFLTLSTVTIYSTVDLTVGTGNYTARRYDIEKKIGIHDFVDQPSWRNRRHTVTDFRFEDGFTRYYVVAANPELEPAVYAQVLTSMTIK